MIHDGGPADGRLERLRRALPGRRRGRVRPLAHAVARAARRLPDLQPGLADRAPARAAAHDGDGDGRPAGGCEFDADRSSERALEVRRRGSVAVLRRHGRLGARPPGAGCPRCCCARAATGCCSTAARARSSSCCARSACPSSTRSSSPTTTSTTGSGCSACSRPSTCAARERPLTLHGPPGLRALIEAMRPVIGRTRYPLRLRELEPHEEVALRRLRRRRRSRSTTA